MKGSHSQHERTELLQPTENKKRASSEFMRKKRAPSQQIRQAPSNFTRKKERSIYPSIGKK